MMVIMVCPAAPPAGTVKGLTSEQMQELDCHVILGNTYHLANRPGGEVVAALGGLHGFSNWPRGMLTDSGGFQMVSLLHLADITEEGVTFQSPVDGSRMLLTPEESIAIQNNLGADIMMQLDDVVPATNTGEDCNQNFPQVSWLACALYAFRGFDLRAYFSVQGVQAAAQQ
jgi:tRNA-guanine family transglycosylase